MKCSNCRQSGHTKRSKKCSKYLETKKDKKSIIKKKVEIDYNSVSDYDYDGPPDIIEYDEDNINHVLESDDEDAWRCQWERGYYYRL